MMYMIPITIQIDSRSRYVVVMVRQPFMDCFDRLTTVGEQRWVQCAPPDTALQIRGRAGEHGIDEQVSCGDLVVCPTSCSCIYRPERNPMEQIILFPKSKRFANRVFKGVVTL